MAKSLEQLERELEDKRAEYKRRWDGYTTRKLADGQLQVFLTNQV